MKKFIGNNIEYAFVTGAFITPREIDGEWAWVVTQFEDDTFYNGKEVTVMETAVSRNELAYAEE